MDMDYMIAILVLVGFVGAIMAFVKSHEALMVPALILLFIGILGLVRGEIIDRSITHLTGTKALSYSVMCIIGSIVIFLKS